jgi:hypothetical protein
VGATAEFEELEKSLAAKKDTLNEHLRVELEKDDQVRVSFCLLLFFPLWVVRSLALSFVWLTR